jgi:hypothetical protein
MDRQVHIHDLPQRSESLKIAPSAVWMDPLDASKFDNESVGSVY